VRLIKRPLGLILRRPLRLFNFRVAVFALFASGFAADKIIFTSFANTSFAKIVATWVLSTDGASKSSCCIALKKMVSLIRVSPPRALVKSCLRPLSCEFERFLRCFKCCKLVVRLAKRVL
jgi:hypothetical protein